MNITAAERRAYLLLEVTLDMPHSHMAIPASKACLTLKARIIWSCRLPADCTSGVVMCKRMLATISWQAAERRTWDAHGDDASPTMAEACLKHFVEDCSGGIEAGLHVRQVLHTNATFSMHSAST